MSLECVYAYNIYTCILSHIGRLAVKYRLHPLAINDVVEMHGRPKVEKYASQWFIVAPFITLEKKVKDSEIKRNSSKCGCCKSRRNNPGKRVPYLEDILRSGLDPEHFTGDFNLISHQVSI